VRAWLYPGQGAQFVGMGRALFDRYPEAVADADEVLGWSLRELCLEDPRGEIGRTRFTQPALYVVNALAHRARLDDGAPPPDMVAGHSLGEYDALLAAGAFDFLTGLRLVRRRGELMDAADGGGMAAVIGLAQEEVSERLTRLAIPGLEVASFNSPTQVVIAGPSEAIARAEDGFVAAGARYRTLDVSAAFHSALMAPAAEELVSELARVELAAPRIPVVSNVTARPHEADGVAELLIRQLREPVRWTESVRWMLEAGIEELEEVGPGRTLTKLVEAIRRPAPAPGRREAGWSAGRLGSAAFRRDHGVRAAYAAGAMGHGISGVELVVRMAEAGLLAMLGTHGLDRAVVENLLRAVRRRLGSEAPFGVNLVAAPGDPDREEAIVDLCLEHGVRCLEAAGFAAPSPALMRYRVAGLERDAGGRASPRHRVLAKVSRLDAARAFLEPPSGRRVAELVERGAVSEEEARLAALAPAADDLCVEADPGWRTDGASARVLLPAVQRLRDELCRTHDYATEPRVGACGGLGSPEAVAGAFLAGADFVLTGSINQCTVEAAQSEAVKELLQQIGVDDTERVPGEDLFELGGTVRVVKRGSFHPARMRRLHETWRLHGAWEEVDPEVRSALETKILGQSFDRAHAAAVDRYRASDPGAVARAEGDPRARMALVFRAHAGRALDAALAGDPDRRADFLVFCGPAMGAFNQWVAGTGLQPWHARHVDLVAGALLDTAAAEVGRRVERIVGTAAFESP
jgi:trans-AT polyketide synthase, acyltransferase and oxidoreductase domains